MPAFEAAILQGADILETDVIKSKDGQVFIFHIHKEMSHLNKDINLTDMTADEISKVRYVNYNRNRTELGLLTLDDLLEHFKGKCMINLDHMWNGCFSETVDAVRRHNMQDQILIKAPATIENLKTVEELAPDFQFMSIIKESDTVSDLIAGMNINYVGVELVFESEKSPCVSPESLQRYRKMGLFLWGNAILYNYKVQLSAGHTDDIAVTGNEDSGWGYFIDNGFNIIQTDWPCVLKRYLMSRIEKCGK